MACAGLRHIYDLARSAKDVQLELIRRTHSVAFSQGLFNLFRVPQPCFARFLVLESDFRDGDDVIPEDPTQSSMGYTKYWPSIWNEYLRVYDQSSPRRAVDFAFWDAERIHGTLLREALKEAGRMCPEFVKRRYGTKRRQSAQTKSLYFVGRHSRACQRTHATEYSGTEPTKYSDWGWIRAQVPYQAITQWWSQCRE